MKTKTVIITALATLLGTTMNVHHAEADERGLPNLVVEVRAERGIRPGTVTAATAFLERLYRDFGVGLEVRSDIASAPMAGKPWRRIVIRQSAIPEQMAASPNHVLGTSYRTPDGPGHVAYVFYDAVVKMARQHHLPLDFVLGYALAHELGHLLLPPGHGEIGIMSADWHQTTLFQVQAGTLRMGRREATIIRDYLDSLSPAN